MKRGIIVLLGLVLFLAGCGGATATSVAPATTTLEVTTTTTVPTTTTLAPTTTSTAAPTTTTTNAAPVTSSEDSQIETMLISGEQRPIDWALAAINANDPELNVGDDSVPVFRRHVLSLAKKTTSSQQEIADISVTAWGIVKKRGFPDTLLRVIEELDASIPDSAPRMTLAEVAAAWTTLRSAE